MEKLYFLAMQYRRNQEIIGYGVQARSRTPDQKRERRAMVRALVDQRGITDNVVLEAMNVVPRHLFVAEALRAHAYEDNSLPIGFGQTISQPYIVARMTELLEVRKGTRVLEIGTGSGYQAAVLATIGCHVFSLERIPELYRATTSLLRQLGYSNVQVYKSDGTLGFPQAAPYERILVTAGGPKVPETLLRQLDEGGIMIIPVGDRPREQTLLKIRKTNGRITAENLDSVVFVNLVGNEGWAR